MSESIGFGLPDRNKSVNPLSPFKPRFTYGVVDGPVQKAEGRRLRVADLALHVVEVDRMLIEPCGGAGLQAAKFETGVVEGGGEAGGGRVVQPARGEALQT